ncbi:hypothetical protein V8E51_015371 [Hyaloscypha variabilis]
MAPSRPRQPKKVINRKALLVSPRDGTNFAPIFPPFASLPALTSELLQKIFCNLDDVSSVCLSLTSRKFYAEYHEQPQHTIVPLWRGYWEKTSQGAWSVKPLRQLIGAWIEDGERYYYCLPKMKFVSIKGKSPEW